VSINTVRKVSGGHEHPLVDVEEYLDLLGHFLSLLSCFDWLLCVCMVE